MAIVDCLFIQHTLDCLKPGGCSGITVMEGDEVNAVPFARWLYINVVPIPWGGSSFSLVDSSGFSLFIQRPSYVAAQSACN